MPKTRWGILATGNIAHSLAAALKSSPGAELLAVASRTAESAQAFGEKWGIPRRYASYDGLAEDPDIEVVYIATPHNFHHANMLLCLGAGKHVLCEKAFTLNAAQAEECIRLARQKGLFLMEAMWMRFFPLMDQVREWLRQGLLGEIRLLQADFCLHRPYDPAHRLDNPALGGGALLDLGIYPLSLASMVLGAPDKIESQALFNPLGVDELDSLLLRYERGALASLSCSMRVYKPREAFLVGTQGYIKIHEIFFRPDRATLHLQGQAAQVVEAPFRGNGYIHEVDEVHRCLGAGPLESPRMPLDETLALMRLMDTIRRQWGMAYPEEA